MKFLKKLYMYCLSVEYEKKSFQLYLLNKMDDICCEKTRENYVYCDVCNKYCNKRLYQNHLKSQTHINNLLRK